MLIHRAKKELPKVESSDKRFVEKLIQFFKDVKNKVKI